MVKKCQCTVGWINKDGTAQMEGIGCDEFRAILWKIVLRQDLDERERRILNKAKEQGW